MSEIRVNGVSLYYEEYGIGEPILCIHGTGSSTALWRDPAAALGKHGRAIVYDRRGFGRSERPDPFVTNVHLQADDAAELLKALDASPAVVIGRSHGGEIAVDLALRYPDRVRALVLCEGGGLSLSPAFRRWLAGVHERLSAAAEADMGTVGEAFLGDVLGDAAWQGLPEPVRQVFTANGPAIVAEERGGMLDVSAAELGTITRRTLIVGARDSGPEFAEATELLAKAMPSARVEWVEGGHLIDAAHPAVLAFVDEVLEQVGTRTRA
jgi:pimeloyl-ACP methyl ester carboxylesterase